jgi:hypothetical protein
MFYRQPMHSAFMLDRAVVRFALRGEGKIEWAAPYYRLRAGFYEAALAVDREARVITVLYVYRARS